MAAARNLSLARLRLRPFDEENFHLVVRLGGETALFFRATMRRAGAVGAPLVWPQHRGNIAFEVTLGDAAATARAFAQAAKIVPLPLVNQRLVTNYLDTRGVVAAYDPADDRLTLSLSSQGSHAARDVLASILHVPAQKLRVVTPDVKGAGEAGAMALVRQ